MRITELGYGMDYMVMQSQQDADTLIEEFEIALRNGLDPNCNIVKTDIYQKTGIDPADLMDYDKKRVELKVQELYELSKRRY